jgi:hypothetical protein
MRHFDEIKRPLTFFPHTAIQESLRQVFFNSQNETQRLEDFSRALHAWHHQLQLNAPDDDETDDETRPKMLACFLKHDYDALTFTATTLKPEDQTLLQEIAPLAKKYHFDLHLAHTTFRRVGHVCYAHSQYGVTQVNVDDSDYSDDGYGCGDDPFGFAYRTNFIVDADKIQMEDESSAERYLTFAARRLDGLPLELSNSAYCGYPQNHNYYNSDDYGDDENESFVNGRITDTTKKCEFAKDGSEVRLLFLT